MQKYISYTKLIGLFLGPLVFTSLMLTPNPDIIPLPVWKFLACTSFMIIWWVFEPVPYAVTALLPAVLYPVTGVLSSYDTFSAYGNPYIFLFMGGFFIAIALEKHNLHSFIAYRAIKVIGFDPSKVVLGMMSATYFLSMWMSNTAACMMMLPIAISIINMLGNTVEDNKYKTNFITSLLLSIPYAATIGGTATVIGSPPNIILASFFAESFEVDISFVKWLYFGIPFSVIMLFAGWIILTKILFRSKFRFDSLDHYIKEEFAEYFLTNSQVKVLVIFLFTIFLWIVRPFLANATTFEINDEIIAVFCGLLLFVTPINLTKGKFLLEWKDTEKLPWGILLLFGGGIAISSAINYLEIFKVIGNFVKANGKITQLSFILISVIVIAIITEFINNTALSVSVIPIMAALCIALGFNPLIVSLIATFTLSLSFMLAIATPPNSFVFINDHLNGKDMAKAGFLLKIVGIILIIIFYTSGLFDVYKIDFKVVQQLETT
ncbi:MAG: DASS family sodium-coupled anion symporter [Sphingobacteriia bacterium]|nr:DASS family sodium-coupled anion symporter [Sphingobacteriia bacterium]